MRATQQWFYAHGPREEMMVENSQSYLANRCGVPQTKISACLRKALDQYAGWHFTWIEESGPRDRITPLEFKSLQARTGLDTAGMSAALSRAESTILQYRTGFLPCPRQIAGKLRTLAAKGNQVQAETGSGECQAAAGIRHLMEDLYPGWQGIETDGHIFTG